MGPIWKSPLSAKGQLAPIAHASCAPSQLITDCVLKLLDTRAREHSPVLACAATASPTHPMRARTVVRKHHEQVKRLFSVLWVFLGHIPREEERPKENNKENSPNRQRNQKCDIRTCKVNLSFSSSRRKGFNHRIQRASDRERRGRSRSKRASLRVGWKGRSWVLYLLLVSLVMPCGHMDAKMTGALLHD